MMKMNTNSRTWKYDKRLNISILLPEGKESVFKEYSKK